MTAEGGAGRVGRYVRMVAQPGQGGALADTLLRVADGLRDTPGCELYVINLSADEPDTVWVTEVWADEAASDRALSGDLGEVGIGDVLELLAGPPELVDLRPLGGAGMPSGGPQRD
jgi:quinol monooxygenase YgiN